MALNLILCHCCCGSIHKVGMEICPYPGKSTSVMSPGPGVSIELSFLSSSIPNIKWKSLLVIRIVPLETQSGPCVRDIIGF